MLRWEASLAAATLRWEKGHIVVIDEWKLVLDIHVGSKWRFWGVLPLLPVSSVHSPDNTRLCPDPPLSAASFSGTGGGVAACLGLCRLLGKTLD